MRWDLDGGRQVFVAAVGFTLACGAPTPGSSADEHGGVTSDPSDSGGVTTTSSSETTETDSTGTSTITTDDGGSSSGDATGEGEGEGEGETATDGSTTGEQDECCPLDMPMIVDVSGSTPNGPFEGKHVWYGYHPPCCHPEDYFVFITPTPTPWQGWGDVGLSDGVLITIPGQTWTPMQWLGEGPATFRTGDYATEAMITIDAIDTLDGFNGPFECYDGGDDWRTMVASFSVVGDGWNLTGSISAPLCDAMTLIHPC